ncbi:gag poly, partial [Fusarium longipes]
VTPSNNDKIAAPVTPAHQQNAANPVTPTPGQHPNLAQEIKHDNRSSESSDNTEIVQLREQVTNMTMEIDNLRQLLQETVNLQAQQAQNSQNNMQNMRNLAHSAAQGKDIREVLKPNPPKPFDGTSAKLPTFLTYARAFISFFPTQFENNSNKFIYIAGRIRGTAAQWIQPIMEEVTTTPESELSARTYQLYNNYAVFKKALRQAFGTVNEKSQAKRKIKTLKQTKSALEYGIEF